jgi:hypothetical protein
MRNLKHQNRRRKLCDGKISYLTMEAACAGMGKVMELAGQQAQPLSVYRHAKCGGFHIGHTPKEIRERFGL